jgi:molecular chaperone HscB
LNYFELFGLETAFELDLAQLSTAFQQLQKTAHPDKFAHASNQEQLLAVQKSANINDAYQTLKNPLRRADYLLTLRGTDMPSEQASFQDNAFLMQQMELREMLAEVASADDVDAALLNLRALLDNGYQQLFVQLQQLLAEQTLTANQQASDILRKLKFYYKLQQEVDRVEEQLFDD